MELTNRQASWLLNVQAEWLEIMEPFSLTEGWSPQYIKRGHAFTPIPRLRREHLRSARLLPSREDLVHEIPKRGIGGEVGTQHGYFAKILWDVTKPEELHLFDISFDRFGEANLLKESQNIIKHVGDSSTNLASMPASYFDWLYIDADHSYAGICRDIDQATKVLKKSGLLIFNDFTYWSPLEAMPYGVPHAVCELCLREGWEVVFFALEPWMYCDIALRRRS